MGEGDVFVHQTGIHAEGFRSLLEDEEVHFNLTTDAEGRLKAIDVTGPNGAFVKGAPKPGQRRRRRRNNNRRPRGDNENKEEEGEDKEAGEAPAEEAEQTEEAPTEKSNTTPAEEN